MMQIMYATYKPINKLYSKSTRTINGRKMRKVMLGFKIAKKSELEAQATKLANAQAKADTNAKKFKTAVITGSATTGAAAVVAGVLHFGLGRGNKKVKEKINNYELVVEERNKSLEEITNIKAERDCAINMAIASDGCCHKLATAIDTHNYEEMYAAVEGHKAIHKELFKDISEESFNAAVAAYDEFIKSLTAQDQQNAQNAQNDQNAQIPQNNQNAQIPQNNQNAQKIAEAQKKYGEACAKVGATRSILDTAKAVLDTAKSASPEADVKELVKAVTEAQTAFDAAEREFKEADAALKALQAKK